MVAKWTAVNDVVASDLEGTLTRGVAWEAMRDYLRENGRGAAYRRFFVRQLPRLLLYQLKLVDERRFKEQWVLKLLRLFRGFDEAQFADFSRYAVEKVIWPQRRLPVVEELLAHKKNGCFVVIVSGIFQPVLDEFAARLGVVGLGTLLESRQGAYTGEVVGQLNVGRAKVARLQQMAPNGRLRVAYGDTRSDIPLLTAADEGVAVHPDKPLRRAAETNGWRILMES